MTSVCDPPPPRFATCVSPGQVIAGGWLKGSVPEGWCEQHLPVSRATLTAWWFPVGAEGPWPEGGLGGRGGTGDFVKCRSGL